MKPFVILRYAQDTVGFTTKGEKYLTVFSEEEEDEMRRFTKLLIVITVLLMAVPAMADYYLAGDFNGWNAAGNIMTDTGSGIYSVSLQFTAGERHEFKITDGTWDVNWPWSGNSWLVADSTGIATVTYDTNTYSDGWLGTEKRIGISSDPGTWTAVGDWQGWNNSNAATAMTALGSGIYYCEQVVAAGTHYYKAVMTGTWDAIGADARSINADNATFDVAADNTTVGFWVNAQNGTIKVAAIPEPSSLLALAALLPVAGLIRRKR